MTRPFEQLSSEPVLLISPGERGKVAGRPAGGFFIPRREKICPAGIITAMAFCNSIKGQGFGETRIEAGGSR